MSYDENTKIYSYISKKRMNDSLITSMDAYELLFPWFNFGVFQLYREKFMALLLDDNGK